MGRNRTRTDRRAPYRRHRPVPRACGLRRTRRRNGETAARPDQTEPTGLHPFRPPRGRTLFEAHQRLSGCHHGRHRRHPRSDLRRGPRAGKGRPALVPCLQDLVRTRHTCHRLDGGQCDGRELPRRLADGKRLLRSAHRHRHRPAVQERYPYVRDLPRSRHALPPRRQTDEVRPTTHCQGRTQTGHRRREETQRTEDIGHTRRKHRTPACGRRGRTLRSRQPQRLHQPVPLPDEPFRCARGRSRGVGRRTVLRL